MLTSGLHAAVCFHVTLGTTVSYLCISELRFQGRGGKVYQRAKRNPGGCMKNQLMDEESVLTDRVIPFPVSLHHSGVCMMGS